MAEADGEVAKRRRTSHNAQNKPKRLIRCGSCDRPLVIAQFTDAQSVMYTRKCTVDAWLGGVPMFQGLDGAFMGALAQVLQKWCRLQAAAQLLRTSSWR